MLLILLGVCVYFSFPKLIGAAGFIVRIFLPFILGYIFSIAVNPLVNFLQKRFGIKRGICAILVLVITIGIVGGVLTAVVWKVVEQIKMLYEHFPAIYQSASDRLKHLSERWALIYGGLPQNVQNIFADFGTGISERFSVFIDDKSSPVVKYAGNFAKSLPSIFIGIIAFLLSSFFMISDADKVSAAVGKLLPEATIKRFRVVRHEITKYFGGYVKAQLTIMSVAFVIIFTGLSILKVEYALLIAIAIAVFDALPFFGSGAALIPWALISFVNTEISTGIGLLIIYLSVIFSRQMIEPKIVGSSIGMHPLVTLMSMYAGYKTFSVGGLILGPVCMMIAISFYKAGIFDGLIRFLTHLKEFLFMQLKSLKNIFASNDGGEH
ncbi:MAG: sporulation integral membrane protein YtvI [Clostridia bacterium]|nr:sporulation integral membrane protein YtvI [Clostridia bacterium]